MTSRFFFEFAYLFGFKPWDGGVSPPELIEVVEGPKALPAGRALDIGCGTGTNCKYFLDHGWDVIGVDYVPRAIRVAKRKAPGAQLVVGDVTKLDEMGIHGPFDLMLDLGCFHSIPDDRRSTYAEQAARVARPGGMLLMFAFGEKGPVGAPIATEQQIRGHFSKDFTMIEVRPGLPEMKQTWYRMERKKAGPD